MATVTRRVQVVSQWAGGGLPPLVWPGVLWWNKAKGVRGSVTENPPWSKSSSWRPSDVKAALGECGTGG